MLVLVGLNVQKTLVSGLQAVTDFGISHVLQEGGNTAMLGETDRRAVVYSHAPLGRLDRRPNGDTANLLEYNCMAGYDWLLNGRSLAFENSNESLSAAFGM